MSVFPDPGVVDVELDVLFDRLAAAGGDEVAAGAARRRLVEHVLPMATRLASRYRHRGPSTEDLIQVARLALVGAVHRFDPRRRDEFIGFVATSIHGELKKYFRDTTWTVRVPRGIQERSLAISAATSDQLARTGVEPTVTELAELLELSSAHVKEALHASAGYRASTLDTSDNERELVLDHVSTEEVVESRDRWRLASSLIRELPERDRRVLYLRYFEEKTQAQIAVCVGVSQMQVSRILSRSLDWLSEQVGEPESKAG